jgi:hypothetical protein
VQQQQTGRRARKRRRKRRRRTRRQQTASEADVIRRAASVDPSLPAALHFACCPCKVEMLLQWLQCYTQHVLQHLRCWPGAWPALSALTCPSLN